VTSFGCHRPTEPTGWVHLLGPETPSRIVTADVDAPATLQRRSRDCEMLRPSMHRSSDGWIDSASFSHPSQRLLPHRPAFRESAFCSRRSRRRERYDTRSEVPRRARKRHPRRTRFAILPKRPTASASCLPERTVRASVSAPLTERAGAFGIRREHSRSSDETHGRTWPRPRTRHARRSRTTRGRDRAGRPVPRIFAPAPRLA